MKDIKLITFDLDDTFWDIEPVIIKAEMETRHWLEERVGVVEWGSMKDLLSFRKELILKNPILEWDISLLRKEIYRDKLKNIIADDLEREEVVEESYKIFIDKRHDVTFYEGVFDAIKQLSKRYPLGVLTNGNADIFKFDIGRYFDFSICSSNVQSNKPGKAHFIKALEGYKNITFNEVVHIGDDQVNDVCGAQDLGINALWFNNKNAKWDQDNAVPIEFNQWNKCIDIIEKINESK